MAEADLRHRDRRGEWLPDPLPAPSALFSWPLRLWPALRSLIAFYWPYNLFYTVLAVVCWLWFTPDLSRTGTFAVGWIAEIYARNAVLIIVLYGSVHLRLYMQRAQDDSPQVQQPLAEHQQPHLHVPQPDPGQRVLDPGKRRPDLDRVRDGHAVAVRQRRAADDRIRHPARSTSCC